MGIRDWLAIIVIVFIVLILLDGFRRKWLERKNTIRVKLDKNIPAADAGDDNDILVKSELPHGGARIKSRADKAERAEEVPVLMDSVDIDDEEIEEYPVQKNEVASNDADDYAEALDEFAADADDYDDLDDIPDFDSDSQGVAEGVEKDTASERANPWHETGLADPDAGTESAEASETMDVQEEADQDDRVSKKSSGGKYRRDGRDGRIEPTFGDDDLTFSRDDQGELDLEHHGLFEHEEEAETDADSGQEQAEEVIIINVMARPGKVIEGRLMLPVLMKQGMRLGDMSIFHRHADNSGKGPVMFSMANMLKPGTFSISEMETFTTLGVCFFMQLPNKLGNMHCFEQMLLTAQAVKEDLDAILKDENRSVFTHQTIEHSRQRIRDFELAMLARK